jgi:WD40 repeat protein
MFGKRSLVIRYAAGLLVRTKFCTIARSAAVLLSTVSLILRVCASLFSLGCCVPYIQDAITKVMWHPKVALLYSSSMDGTVKVWDARTGKAERNFHGHREPILDFDITR